MGATYGDTFVQGDYTYTVQMPVIIIDDRPDKGFVSVEATNKTKSSYGGIPSLVTYNGETFYVQDLTECFKDCINLTTAPTLPDLVPESDPTYGGDNESAMYGCFSGCSKLTSVPAFPRNATGLWNTFENCTSLTIPPTIPSNIRQLGETFKGCTSLASAPTIPSGVESMDGTFKGCTSLTSAPTIPSRVRWLDETFEGCTSLASAPTIPSGVETMTGTFKGCTSLVSSPTIPSGVDMLDSCFEGCTSLKTPPSSIPNTVGQMTSCFKNCINLESTPSAIPATVTSLRSAFENCRKITSPPQIANGVVNMSSTFSGCYSLNTFPSIPSSVLYLDNGFRDCTSLNSVPQIPSTVLWMEQCFFGCTSLEGIITLHNSPSKYFEIFKHTVEDIIIVVDSVTPWKSVANEYENVYLRCASATSAPTVAATSLRVDDGGTTESEMGEYAYITVAPSLDTENWYGNESTVTLRIDGDSETPTWYDSNNTAVSSMQTGQTYHSWVDIGDYVSHTLSFVASDSAGHSSVAVNLVFPQAFALMSFKAGGTGVAIGTHATEDNFTVALPTNFVGDDIDNPTGLAVRGQPVPPTFYYQTKPSDPLDLPVTPCIVIQTSDMSLWYCNGTSYSLIVNPSAAPKMLPGIICPFGGSSAPTGFIMCDGQAVSRTTYAALFAVIGTTYGRGNGSTTFNVPDLRGRTVIGSNSSHALGSTGGAETVKLTKNQSALPAHGHGFTQPTVNGGATTTGEKSLTGWTALYSDTGMFNPGNGYRSGIISQGGVRSTSYRPAWTGGTSYDMSINATHTHSQVAHTHSVSGGAVSQNNGWDASQAHNNMQPFATINYIISTGG